MTELRQRMLDAMVQRGFAQRTQVHISAHRGRDFSVIVDGISN